MAAAPRPVVRRHRHAGLDLGESVTVEPGARYDLVAECVRAYGFEVTVVYRGALFQQVPVAALI